MRLHNKKALITGGGSGIGRATAELFAQEGASVVVADYRAEAARQTAATIQAMGGNAIPVTADVQDREQVEQMVRLALEAGGAIDILFNSAGMLTFGSVLDTEPDVWNRIIAVNLTGVYLCSRAVLPYMIRRGGGVIVNVSSSTGAHDAAKNSVAYIASKGGVTLLTKAMAVDHAKDNVRVNAIAPGPTDTAMLRDNFTPEALAAFSKSFPMQRLGRPLELAQAVLFLASDDASFVTGAVVAVDGGQTAEV